MTARALAALALALASLALALASLAPARAAEVAVPEAGVGLRASAEPRGAPVTPDREGAPLYFGKPSRWLPFEAVLEGRGEAVEGTLVLAAAPSMSLETPPLELRRRVSVPARGRKRVTLPVPPSFALACELSLEAEGGARVSLGQGESARFIPAPVAIPEAASVVVFATSAREPSLAHLARAREAGPPAWPHYEPGYHGYAAAPGPVLGDERIIVPVDPASLPADPWSYDGVDVVVLDDVPLAEVSPRVAAALASFTARGGVLAVSLREAAAGAGASPLAPLLPGLPDGLESAARLRPLGDLVEAPLLSDATAFAPREGATLWAPASRAVLHRSHGRGAVVLLGFSLAAPAVRGWPGAPILLDALCDARRPPAVDHAGGLRGADLPRIAGQVVRDAALKPAPPYTSVAAFLLPYALFVIAVPYAVFRRLDRLEWAWAAVLFLSLAGGGGVYAASGRWLATETVARVVTVVDAGAAAAGPAPRHGVCALFSADGGRVDLALDAPEAVVCVAPAVHADAPPGTVLLACDGARAAAVPTHVQDTCLLETMDEERLEGRISLGPGLAVERDAALEVGRAWIVCGDGAAEVAVPPGTTLLERPTRSLGDLLARLRAEPARPQGAIAAAVLEACASSLRARERPLLVFSYAGAPVLRPGGVVREQADAFGVLEADAPLEACISAPARAARWASRRISLADDAPPEFLLALPVPPGFDVAETIARGSLERWRSYYGRPAFRLPGDGSWLERDEAVDPALVSRTPLGTAYARVRWSARSGRGSPPRAFDFSAVLARRP